jgi:superfamily II DNA or RNA helicase
VVRRRVGEPGLRPLIDRIAALVLEVGSVNRAQQVLSRELADDRSEGFVYANRLHALLSEDPSKSVNPGTLKTIETALARLDADAPASFEVDPALQAEAQARWPGTATAVQAGTPEERLRYLATEMGTPPAVVRLLLGDVEVGNGSKGGAPATRASTPEEPDWSFQDEAYERCLQALSEGTNKKVGLVLPTGGGKTRVAIRILLKMLDRSELREPRVIWVTHRKRLRIQATRELQRAVTRGTSDLPAMAAGLLSDQVEICMLSKLTETLDRYSGQIALVVVDEAHHAAAASYAPIFERPSLPGLFLTATPNRTDLLPIGIDEIAFSTTYRDLFDRGVVLEPKLDDLTIEGFDWSIPERVEELAAYLLEEASDRFVKTLTVVSRVEQAEALYDALIERRPADHVLAEEDIGFVHGGASSTGDGTQDFLDEFQAKPRGILIATGGLLGEGYDDPAVDSTVVTYATGSMLELMQVAGRCMRYAPEKKAAYVLQVRDSALAYHWEQGWLYQDISDLLRPRIETVPFGNLAERRTVATEILDRHNVSAGIKLAALESLEEVGVTDRVSLLLTGLPFSGSAERFDQDANWGAVLVPPRERSTFLRVFNSYSETYENVNDTKAFLEQFLPYEAGSGSRWKRYVDMLAAMRAAGAERRGGGFADSAARPQTAETGTTWLTHITFSYRPDLPADLDAFLADAINRDAVATEFLSDPASWALAIKVPLPLKGTMALILDDHGSEWIGQQRKLLRTNLSNTQAIESFATVAAWRAQLGVGTPLPRFIEDRMERLLSDAGWGSLSMPLR